MKCLYNNSFENKLNIVVLTIDKFKANKN